MSDRLKDFYLIRLEGTGEGYVMQEHQHVQLLVSHGAPVAVYHEDEIPFDDGEFPVVIRFGEYPGWHVSIDRATARKIIDGLVEMTADE